VGTAVKSRASPADSTTPWWLDNGRLLTRAEDNRTRELRRFDDAVAWRAGWMDPGGEIGGPGGEMKTYHVPYRALVPEKLDGLLVAGRCISTSHVAAAAAKSMGNCVATGHAARIACAIAVSRRVQPREVKVAELQSRLRADGVVLEI